MGECVTCPVPTRRATPDDVYGTRGDRLRVSLQDIRNLAGLFVRTDTRFRGFGLLLQFALIFAFGSITHARSSCGRVEWGARDLGAAPVSAEPDANPWAGL